MFDMAIIATRRDGMVEATVTATLPDSCHHARLGDIYPGGMIQYVVDPGHAQIWVSFTHDDGVGCSDVIEEWNEKRMIPDNYHDRIVAIGKFRDEEFKAEAKIQGDPPGLPI